MIVDTVDQLAACRRLSPLIEPVLTFLRERPDAADGRYDLDGDNAFVMVQRYTTEPAADKRWEAHRTYVDVQVVLEGTERIGYAPLNTLAETTPYDPATDLTWLAGRGDFRGDFIRMSAGMFMILHPRDAHMPGVIADDPRNPQRPQPVRKAVFKLATSSFAG